MDVICFILIFLEHLVVKSFNCWWFLFKLLSYC